MKVIRFLIFIGLLFNCSLSLAQHAGLYMNGQIFVKLKENSKIDISFDKNVSELKKHPLREIIAKYEISKIHKPFRLQKPIIQSVFLVEFPEIKDINRLITELKNLPFVEYAEQVPLYELFLTPDDLHPNQWHLTNIQAEAAWNLSTGSSSVVIAMVDDAVLLGHEDIAPVLWNNSGEIPNNNIDDDGNGYIDDINGWDAADNDNNPTPPSSASNTNFTHGTHTSGIAAAATDNGLGIASISYNVKLMAVKTKTNASSGPSLQAPYLGVEYAIAAGADVISMSWGGGAYSQTYQNLFDLAYSQGIVLVAAAGNSNTDIPMYPAAYNYVISVGSTNDHDIKSSFSNYGSTVDLMAPGSSIWSCLAGSNSSYGYLSGTSMACPLVSGLAALMLSKNPYLQPDEIESCLKGGCDNIDILNPSYAGQLGAGRINALKTMQCIKPINALFTSDFTRVCPGGGIQYTDQSTNNPTSWQWVFSGGIPSATSVQNPVVQYPASGIYNVTLIVTNSLGSDTLTKSNYITVSPPTAVITSGNQTTLAGFPVNIQIILTGNPPWTVTYSDGTNNFTLANITNTPFYLTVLPFDTTTYSLVSVNDLSCSGMASGSVLVTAIIQNDPFCLAINSAQKISDTEGNFPGILDNNDLFGTDVASLGDLDGDGVPDLAIGSMWDDDGGTDYGAIWITFLKPDGTVKSVQKISSTQGNFNGILSSDIRFGGYMSQLGDLDNDGNMDLAAGTFYDDDGGLNRGAVWILFLNQNGTVKAEQKISDLQGNFSGILDNSDCFGSGVAFLGDLDNDGIEDLAVGEAFDDDGGTDLGACWILFLNSNGTVKSYQKISSTQGGFTGSLNTMDRFGFCISSAGDVNKDGIMDVAVGAPSDDDGGTDEGAVWILFLNSNGTVKSYQKISATQGNFNGSLNAGDFFGIRISPLGDLNSDGIPDIAVGAPYDDDGGTDRGAVWILYLNNDGTVKSYSKINSTASVFSGNISDYDEFGLGVTNLGDLDGNSIMDIAVGTRKSDDGGTDRGAVWLINLTDTCPPDTTPVAPQSCSAAAAFWADTVCVNDSTSFFDISTDSSANIIIWRWYFGDGDSLWGVQNPKHLYSIADTFTVTLIVGNNDSIPCFDTVSKEVIVLDTNTVFTPPGDTICLGDSVSLGPLNIICSKTPYAYLWSPATGLSDTDIANPKASPASTTTYYVTVTDSLNITSTSSIKITVNSSCCRSFASISSDTFYCLNEPVQLSNNSVTKSGAFFSWYFGTDAVPSSYIGTTPPPVVFLSPGTHTVRLIAYDSCGTDTAFHTLYRYPPPYSYAGKDTALCHSDTVQLGTTPVSNYFYQWIPASGLSNDSIANPAVFVNNSITYILKATNSETNCSSYDSVTITLMLTPPNISVTAVQTTIPFGSATTISASGGVTYQWSTGESNPSIIVTPSTTTIYSVTVTNSAGCTASDSIKIIVISCSTPFIPSAFSPNGDGNNDALYIRGITDSCFTSMNFFVYNRWGQMVWETTSAAKGWDGSFNGKPLNPGVFVYYLKITWLNGEEDMLKGNFTLVK